LVILDNSNRVIVTTERSGYQALQDLSDDALGRAKRQAEDNTYEYAPTSKDRTGAAQLVGSATTRTRGWRVFVSQPSVMVRLPSAGYFALTLGVILLALGGAVLGARAFADTVTRPL